MKLPPATFWTWFAGFASRLPSGDLPEAILSELLEQLHCFDDRVYFELSTNTATNELILTASGNTAVFPVIDSFVAAAPRIDGWSFLALKPPLGFAFTYRDNGIVLAASELWFLPLKSASEPRSLGLCLGVPDPDFIFERQSVDTAYTIIETGIGERSCAEDVQYLELDTLPRNPSADGYLPLPRLAEYIAWHKLQYAH